MHAADTTTGHPEDIYGKALPIVRDLGIGPSMAAEVAGDKLYVIGRGKLSVCDIADPANPKVVGSLRGLGNTRQIAVRRGVAYVTARENGVFIVDVREPTAPRLIAHYDAIEVATGVDVCGRVLFVACRLHGVETVDVRDPANPRHLGIARTGEAQSVAARDGYAYVGVWGSSELVVVDARNPREPQITARRPLDGLGDGVAVRGKYVFVATGHHSRLQPRRKPADPGYGRGHGLEIFDRTDPAKPVFVSRVKTPRFYQIGNDMWSVKLAGDYAFVADTYNGVFVVNVKNPRKPRFVAHRQLPWHKSRRLPAFVGGLALAKDYIYVAGGWTDLHVVAAPGLAKPCSPRPEQRIGIPPAKPRRHAKFRIYQPEGQVCAVAMMDGVALVAAGSDGLHEVELWPKIKLLKRYPTQGFAMDVAVRGDLVLVAEDFGGLSIWRRTGRGELTPVARYKPRAKPVRRVVVPGPARYALVRVALSVLEVLDVSDPANPARVLRDSGHGFLYDIGDELIDGRVVPMLWQLGGVRWYDLYGDGLPRFSGDQYPHRLGGGGIAVLGRQTLVITRGGYVVMDRSERRPPDELTVHRVPGRRLRGQCLVRGHALYLAHRAGGEVCVVDVADIKRPKLLQCFGLPGNPGQVVVHNGSLVIPNGYEGLWVSRDAAR